MRVTINGVAYTVTQKQCQNAFDMLERGSTARLVAAMTPVRKPGNRPKYTARQAATVRRLKSQGHTVRAIAAQVGLSVSCVQRICTKENQ